MLLKSVTAFIKVEEEFEAEKDCLWGALKPVLKAAGCIVHASEELRTVFVNSVGGLEVETMDDAFEPFSYVIPKTILESASPIATAEEFKREKDAAEAQRRAERARERLAVLEREAYTISVRIAQVKKEAGL